MTVWVTCHHALLCDDWQIDCRGLISHGCAAVGAMCQRCALHTRGAEAREWERVWGRESECSFVTFHVGGEYPFIIRSRAASR